MTATRIGLFMQAAILATLLAFTVSQDRASIVIHVSGQTIQLANPSPSQPKGESSDLEGQP